MKILLLGSGGMAGQMLKIELQKLKSEIELIDVARNNLVTEPKIKLDIRDFSKLKLIIEDNQFDFVINCIGILNQNAEKSPSEAVLINSYLPHFLEEITLSSKTKVIHISTDCVFSGMKGEYLENDLKDGNGYYAQTKSIGELNNPKDLTIRTSIIGPDLNKNGIGLFNWFVNQKGKVNGYSNAYWSGVTTLELANYIVKIIRESKFPTGIIHLTNNNKISKYDLLRIIRDEFNMDFVELIDSDSYVSDKSFLNTRIDTLQNVSSYNKMISELKYWMIKELNWHI
jgi:dTDP-4-dehydrorhamnose reductase